MSALSVFMTSSLAFPSFSIMPGYRDVCFRASMYGSNHPGRSMRTSSVRPNTGMVIVSNV